MKFSNYIVASEADQAKERGGSKSQPCGPGMHFLNKDLSLGPAKALAAGKGALQTPEVLRELYRPLESRVGIFY